MNEHRKGIYKEINVNLLHIWPYFSVLEHLFWISAKSWSMLFPCVLFLFFYLFFIFYIVVDFVTHWNETAMGLHVFPIPIPPPTSLSTRSLFPCVLESYCILTCIAIVA